MGSGSIHLAGQSVRSAPVGVPCRGWPLNGSCPVLLSDGRWWCRGCTDKRQEAIAAGLPDVSEAQPAEIRIVNRLTDTPLICACGGDALAYRHEMSLGHLEWSLRQKFLTEQKIGASAFAIERVE